MEAASSGREDARVAPPRYPSWKCSRQSSEKSPWRLEVKSGGACGPGLQIVWTSSRTRAASLRSAAPLQLLPLSLGSG